MGMTGEAIRPPRLVLVAAADTTVDVDVRDELVEMVAYLRGKAARLAGDPEGDRYARVIRSWIALLERAIRRLR
jgi:hypothetical protein